MQLVKELLEVSAQHPDNGYSGELVRLVEEGMGRSEMMDDWVRKGRSEGSFYKALKALKDVLVKYAFLEKGGFDGASVKRMEVWEKHKVVKQLMIAAKKEAAVTLAIEVVQLAQRVGYTEVVSSLASDLEYHFGAVAPDTRRYLRYKKIRKDSMSMLMDEIEVKSLQVELEHCLRKNKGLGKLSARMEELRMKKKGSYLFMRFRFAVLSAWCERMGDSDGMLRAYRETAKFYRSASTAVPKGAFLNLYFRLSSFLIRERLFADAEACLSKALGIAPEGSHNWHVLMLQRAQVGFASDKPSIALAALRSAENAPREFESREIEQEWEKVRVRLFGLGVTGNNE